MSVFQSIKGTFQAGLKSITSRDATKEEKVKYVRSPVNIDAGADLLNKYQNVWKELHVNAEKNSRSAEDADILISQLYVMYDKQAEVMGNLHTSVADLPVILTQLQELTDVLASLEEEYDIVEAALAQLENVCEEQELARAKVIDGQKLAAYKDKRYDELEKIKVQLAKDHAKKMQGYEKQRQTKLKERQDVFEEKFQDDLEYYKSHGRLERLSTSSSESAKKAEQLAQISWEMEDAGLDEFLGTDQSTDSIVAAAEGIFDEEESVESQSEEDEEPEERVDVTLPKENLNQMSESTGSEKKEVENVHGKDEGPKEDANQLTDSTQREDETKEKSEADDS